jgi:hypothetical protein
MKLRDVELYEFFVYDRENDQAVARKMKNDESEYNCMKLRDMTSGHFVGFHLPLDTEVKLFKGIWDFGYYSFEE